MIWDVLFKLLGTFLPWIFSGEKKTEVHRVVGLDGLSRDKLSDAFPTLLVGLVLLSCTGCSWSFFGERRTTTVVLVNAGAAIEIATDELVEIKVGGKEQLRNLATAKVIPLASYRALKARKPDLPDVVGETACGFKVEDNIIVQAEPVPTGVITSTKKLRIVVDGKVGEKRLTGQVAMAATAYAALVKE